MNWVIVPFLDCPDYTRAAIEDVLAQSIPCSLLLIDNGSQEPGRAVGEEYTRRYPARILRWCHDPPLPSLAATWNRALRFVWEATGTHAWVINNDVRLHRCTYEHLLGALQAYDALFVTATGVTPAQFAVFSAFPTDVAAVNAQVWHVPGEDLHGGSPLPGPDFSCYVISKDCHEKYQFDESYIPAYVEDIDYHRRLMLGGDGQRIFGTGLPFEHIGSGTLQSDPRTRMRLERLIEQGSRRHHLEKWGGPANAERYAVPFDPASARDGVATQELFARVRVGDPAIDAPQ